MPSHTFEQDIRDEEDEERDVVVIAMHVKVCFEALDSRVANIRPFDMSVRVCGQDILLTIEECKQKQDEERRQDIKIAFAQQFLLCDRIDIIPSSVIDHLNLLVRNAGFSKLSHLESSRTGGIVGINGTVCQSR